MSFPSATEIPTKPKVMCDDSVVRTFHKTAPQQHNGINTVTPGYVYAKGVRVYGIRDDATGGFFASGTTPHYRLVARP